jgi:hypothetical protein
MQVGDTVRYEERYEDEEGFFVFEGVVLNIEGDEVLLSDDEEDSLLVSMEWLEAHLTTAELGHHGC